MSGKNQTLQLWPKMYSPNQIAVVFYHQYLWKESSDLLDFLHGDIKRNIASEFSTFGWLWPVVPVIQSDCRILWSSIFREGIDRSRRFFAWR